MEVSDRGAEGVNSLDVGQRVALRADHSRVGVIIEELVAIDGRRRFRVFHSGELNQDYFEDQVERVNDERPRDEWILRIADRRFVSHNEFRARLTATRLGNPQADHIFALRAARIQYIPFQFKPLLRLLRADQPRLLIADDVGVGKTIEAGLILKELSARQQLDRVVVLCPKALTGKWRTEMRRFDENFRILSADSLRYCLDETHYGGEWPAEYARSIVHYELFRREPYLLGDSGNRGRRHRGLLELDPPPRFDLVIADEVHHLRTPGTGSHRLIEHLCLTAEAVVMLSATPIQVDADNLFTLLHLLRPDLFPNRSVFREIVAPNRHLTEAIRLLRFGSSLQDDWVTGAMSALDRAGETSWGRAVLKSDSRFQAVKARLNDGIRDDHSRVMSIHDLEELHSLAHIMNRTRRRDIGRFTLRDPQTVAVEFTPHQRQLYEAVLAFRREVLLQRHDPQVVRLILDTLERQAASCINAMGATIAAILEQGGAITGTTDDPDVDSGANLPPRVPTVILERARELLAAARELSDDDPKLERLRAIVEDRIADSAGPAKVLVFSFFLNTISYLESRLRESGVRVGVVTGRVPDVERENLRERFRHSRDDPDALDVLLSSEVGCEGLDYEFCDTLVNYDIPWNPMRIEQRIGRIDRFGQESEKVIIANFVTPGTVEERVFFRCFDRLGVFRDTIGDLEEVLGTVVQDLNRITLDPSLTDEQAEQQARQAADNAIRLADQQRRLDEESGELFGLDDAFTEEVKDVVDGGRFVAEADLRALIESFLISGVVGGRLVSKTDTIHTLRLSERGRRELASRIRTQPRTAQSTVSFLNALEQSGGVDVTFDQATALDHRELEFVTPVHPLAREAARYWSTDRDLPISRLALRSSSVPHGLYIVSCEIWETIAARSGVQLLCLAATLPDGAFASELSRDFIRLLAAARDLDRTIEYSDTEIRSALERLDGYSDERRRESVRSLESANEELLNRRLASLNSHYESRRRRIEAELRNASEGRIVRMKESERAIVDADYQRRVISLEQARRVDVLTNRIAVAIVEVFDGH